MNSKRVAVFAVAAFSLSCLLAVAAPASAATVQVRIQNSDFVFHPASVTITAGDTVEFINDDPIAHDLTFQDTSVAGPGAFAAGAHFNHTFAANGTFKFRCAVHSSDFSSGMVGVVQVGTTPAAPPPAKPSPGFELVGSLAAVGAVALLMSRRRK